MRLYSVQKADGTWCGCPAMSEFNAWRAASHYNSDLLRMKVRRTTEELIYDAEASGYRCVEVELVEKKP